MGFRQVTDFHLLDLAVRAGLSFGTFDGRFARALGEEDRRYVDLIPV